MYFSVCQFISDQIMELDLGDCNITDTALEKICICKNLQVLNLNSTKGHRTSISSEGLLYVHCWMSEQ